MIFIILLWIFLIILIIYPNKYIFLIYAIIATIIINYNVYNTIYINYNSGTLKKYEKYKILFILIILILIFLFLWLYLFFNIPFIFKELHK